MYSIPEGVRVVLLRAAGVWVGIALLAVLNGAMRDLLITPHTGDQTGRAISCFTLSAAILAVTWASLGWIGTTTTASALRVGLLWLAMTIAFEFGAGHYAFHTPWATLLADYNVARGLLWVLVLVVTALAPFLCLRSQRP